MGDFGVSTFWHLLILLEILHLMVQTSCQKSNFKANKKVKEPRIFANFSKSPNFFHQRHGVLQKSLSLTEKIRDFTKSCKKPRLFDLFIGLTVGLLKLFLDYQMQNFK